MISVRGVINDFITLSSTAADYIRFSSSMVSVFIVKDTLGNLLIDENGYYMLVDENGIAIGY